MSNIKKTRTVYIISSMLFNKSYIGSTSKTLNIRLKEHQSKINITACKEIIEYGDVIIASLLVVNNCTRQEILIKEQEFITNYKDIIVNKHKAFRTHDELLLQNKESKGRNKEHNTLIKSTKFNCECGGEYTRNHKTTHFKTNKHLTFLSKQ
jgi:hypothetical protein